MRSHSTEAHMAAQQEREADALVATAWESTWLARRLRSTLGGCTNMRLRTITPFVAATVVASLSQAPTTRELLNPQWGAVFAPASARQLLRQCSRGPPTPIWG